MWLEIDYKLKSGNDDRNLVIRSNYVMNEQERSTTDKGDYTICMNLTPQVELTEELLMARMTAMNFDNFEQDEAEDDIIELGMLHVDMENLSQFTWAGNADAFTQEQLAELADYAVHYYERHCDDDIIINEF